MKQVLRRRFWVETLAAGAALVSLVLTLVWRDWIEIAFHVDPDHHTGSREWLIVSTSVALFLILSGVAHAEWRRATAGGVEA
jgi:hypothetical protein